MKILIALLAAMAVAAANPLPLVHIIVNIDASGNPVTSPRESVIVQPLSVNLPIVDVPVNSVIVPEPVLPSPEVPKPEPIEVGVSEFPVLLSEPVKIGTPELPVIVSEPVVFPSPVVPQITIAAPINSPKSILTFSTK